MIRIINADVIDGLRSLPEKSVHCVVTSPPYWGLRDYGIEGQIGLEPTPEEYLEKMVQVFREVRRVLRDDGTAWVNMGDNYATGGYEPHDKGAALNGYDCPAGWAAASRGQGAMKIAGVGGLKQKDLVGMPWRLAFALQADGWYLRSDIIWAKPNPMPESVTDRPTRSHEYVFLLAKSARYFYDADAVREAQTGNAHSRGEGITPKTVKGNGGLIKANESFHRSTAQYIEIPGGRNRRDVWTITTQPTPEAHFATFPEALVEPCIKAGTSERGCCSVCGAPWVRVVEKTQYQPEIVPIGVRFVDESRGDKTRKLSGPEYNKSVKKLSETWQPTCTCNAGPVPCVVLDPFGGSGTVAKVARDLNRDAILIEINPAYVEIARRKLRADEQLFENVKVITA